MESTSQDISKLSSEIERVKYLTRFNEALARSCLWIGSITLACMVLIITLLILLRYGFNESPVYSEELSKYLMVLFTFFFAPYAYREGLHSGVSLLVTSWPTKVQHTIAFLMHFLILFSICYLTKVGIDFFFNGFNLQSPTFEISYSWFYWVIPLSFFLTIPVALELMIVEFRKIIA